MKKAVPKLPFYLTAAFAAVCAVGFYFLRTNAVATMEIMKNCTREICPSDSALVCSNGQCAFCKSDSECSIGHPNYVCKSYSQPVSIPGEKGVRTLTEEISKCHHKGLLPLISTDLMALGFAFVTAAIAAGGGIGGGGILVSLYVLVLQFSAHDAIPLSKATILGGGIANFLYFISERHPTADRPRIDMNIALLMEPLTLAGTTVGVLCNRTFPAKIIVILLILILTITTISTALKGFRVWKQEHEEVEAASRPSSPPALKQNKAPEHYTRLPTHDAEENGGGDDAAPAQVSEELAQMLEAERYFGVRQLGVLVVVWVVIVVMSLIKGGADASYVGCGTPGYWFFFFMVFPFVMTVTFFTGKYLMDLHERKERLSYVFQPGDIQWTTRNTRLYPLLCFFAGWVSGLLGAGGGMIKGPLLLELGVPPQVTQATTAFMVLFTASATTAQFLILGSLQLDYALLFMICGFLSAWVGQSGIQHLIKKHKKQSLIIFALTFILAASVALIGFTGVMNLRRDAKLGKGDGFRSLCV